MDIEQLIRGPILQPLPDGAVNWFPDGALAGDAKGRISFVGEFSEFQRRFPAPPPHLRDSEGVICPPMLDAHTHVSQHPIRGRFFNGVDDDSPNGKLLGALHRNVYPCETMSVNPEVAGAIARGFALDALSNGVVGGAAFMTPHGAAVEAAIRELGDLWRVGLVLMNANCPPHLRTDEANFDRTVELLAGAFGKRVMIADRFAVCCDSHLRRRGVEMARKFNLRMETHLNESQKEKALVEQVLYKDYASYADVYRRDGVLDRTPILAGCVHMKPEELDIVAAARRAAIAHCPTSNTLLGSGIMPLNEIRQRNIPYAICTDVGASPTVSLLAEMAQYLRVHCGRSKLATPGEALFRATLAPALILGVEDRAGLLQPGASLSFIEIAKTPGFSPASADEAVLNHLLGMTWDDLGKLVMASKTGDLIALAADIVSTAKKLKDKVQRVTLNGQLTWAR